MHTHTHTHEYRYVYFVYKTRPRQRGGHFAFQSNISKHRIEKKN